MEQSIEAPALSDAVYVSDACLFRPFKPSGFGDHSTVFLPVRRKVAHEASLDRGGRRWSGVGTRGRGRVAASVSSRTCRAIAFATGLLTTPWCLSDSRETTSGCHFVWSVYAMTPLRK